MRVLRTIFPLFLLLFTLSVRAQMPGASAELEPVKWTISMVKVEEGAWDVVFRADITHGWYVYSQQSFGDMGPIPTTIVFDTLAHARPDGAPRETGEKVVQAHDPMFDMEVKKFKGYALFTQRVKVSDPSLPLTGRLDYQTCDDSKCIFPDPMYFRVTLAADKGEFAALPFTAGGPGGAAAAAEDEPVKWSLTTEKVKDGLWRFRFTAEVEDGWAIYSQESFGDGPIPTSFVLDSLAPARFLGPAKEESADVHEGMDDMFGIKVRKFKHRVTFVQEVAVTDVAKDISGVVNYMTCDDSKCIFPDPPPPFSVNLATGAIRIGAVTVAPGGECKYKLATVDLGAPVVKSTTEVGEVKEASSLWKILFLGFLGGLVALLTPCVFPMIPLTVSFFTKGSQDRRKGLINATLYGLFIFLVYVLLSIPFHVMDSINPDILNDISTNVWLNIAFFVIFLFFAFSFFGYYEITMPEGLTNRVSSAEGVGGLVGIFFMALTLALVSFSCTGPILGSLLAGALTSDGGAMQLTAGMSGFGLALALPFALFAAFPGWMNSLPRSGGWLNTVKVVLGFLELALAFKFLSNADMVRHWGLLKIEPFLVIWILVALAMAMYLFGFIRFPHDTPGEKPSKVRLVLGALSFAAALYLASGFRYDEQKQSFTPLTLLSGLAPPVGYSWIYPKHCPNNLDCFKDLAQGMAYAREKNKPVMIDFTGHACVNCRKMEEHVWPLPEIDRYLREEFVLISLYVDEKLELPAEEQITVQSKATGSRKLMRTGDKWQHFQTEYFNNNSQPYYVLLTPDGKLLNSPVGYTPNAAEYAAFLECGLQAWKGMK